MIGRGLESVKPVVVVVAVLVYVVSGFGRTDIAAQGRGGGRGGRGGGAPAPQGRQGAPVDLTGTWVSVVTEDWQWRMMMRGGTSKGAYFLASDLPSDVAQRDRILLKVMGSPDPRQIDGMGGADPLTSKVAIVSKSERPGIDVDYLFLQVWVEKAEVSDAQNCGNILAGVAPFAIERGLVRGCDPQTRVSIFMSVLLGGFRAVFSLLLTVMLIALGIGALIGGWLDRRFTRPAATLMAVQVLFAVTALIGLAFADASTIMKSRNPGGENTALPTELITRVR